MPPLFNLNMKLTIVPIAFILCMLFVHADNSSGPFTQNNLFDSPIFKNAPQNILDEYQQVRLWPMINNTSFDEKKNFTITTSGIGKITPFPNGFDFSCDLNDLNVSDLNFPDDDPFIRLDGTSTTTANIPFDMGIYSNDASYFDNTVSIRSIFPTGNPKAPNYAALNLDSSTIAEDDNADLTGGFYGVSLISQNNVNPTKSDIHFAYVGNPLDPLHEFATFQSNGNLKFWKSSDFNGDINSIGDVNAKRFCFPDHTCQTTAATGSSSGYDATKLDLNGGNQASWTPTSVVVPNLNADLVDGQHASAFLTKTQGDGNYLKLDASNGPLTGDLNFGSNKAIFNSAGKFIQKDSNNNLSINSDNNITVGATVLTVNGKIQTTGQFISTLATGTAPFSVASTTNVANLNCSSLSGNVIGTSGANIPLMSTANQWSANQTTTSTNAWAAGTTTSTGSQAKLYYDTTLNMGVLEMLTPVSGPNAGRPFKIHAGNANGAISARNGGDLILPAGSGAGGGVDGNVFVTVGDFNVVNHVYAQKSIRTDQNFVWNGTNGLNKTLTVGDGSGGSCTIDVNGGIITKSTC